MANVPPVFTIIFLSLLLLDFSYSLVLEETTVVATNGESLRLEGFMAHEDFAAALDKALQARIRTAMQTAIDNSKIESVLLMTNLNKQQYTFLQLLYSLSIRDVDFSNLLLQLFSEEEGGVSALRNNELLSTINYPTEFTYEVVKCMTEGRKTGLREVPHFIEKDILKLINKDKILNRASSEGNTEIVNWLCSMDCKVNFEPIGLAWKNNQWDIIHILLHNIKLSDIKPSEEVIRMTNEKNETLLHFAAESNCSDLLKTMIEGGWVVNVLSSDGLTPLHKAIASNCLSCINLLLEKGADVSLGVSVLNLAIQGNNFLAVESLTKANASMHWRDNDGLSPLYVSWRKLSVSLLQNLVDSKLQRAKDLRIFQVEKGTIYEALWCQTDNAENFSHVYASQKKIMKYLDHDDDEFEETPLLSAISKFGNKKQLQLLLDGVDDTSKELLFLQALDHKNKDMVYLLLESGVGVDIKDKNGQTALHHATIWGDVQLVQKLINKHFCMSVEDNIGYNPVFYAILNGFEEILSTYFDKGFDVNHKSSNNRTPLHIAVESKKADIVRIILGKGASLNDRDAGNYTVLCRGVEKGHLEIVKMLIERGAKVNAPINDGFTSLHVASRNGFPEIVKLLITNGADMRAGDIHGLTPLHAAVFNNKLSVVRVMVEFSKGIVNVTTKNGTQGVHLAAALGNVEMLNYLIDNGANVDAKDSGCETPLYKAAQAGKELAVIQLLNRGANIEHSTLFGWRPLHTASSNGHIDSVKVLIERGADVNSRNIDEKTPLFEATFYHKIEVVKALIEHGANVNLPGRLYTVSITPLKVAKLLNNKHLIDLLSSFGAIEIIPGYNGPTFTRIDPSGKFVVNWNSQCINNWIKSQKSVFTVSC